MTMSGATQIRAGVIRPEIIIPLRQGLGETSQPSEESADIRKGIALGDPVRVIREPYFGQLGTVTALPADLQTIPTESQVRVLEVELSNAERLIVPRANVEVLEG